MAGWREFFERRKAQAVELIRPDPSNKDPWYPFDSAGYTWSSAIEDAVDSSTRLAWRNSTVSDLIPVNPFEIDERTSLPSVWSAVLGIPASTLQSSPVSSAKTLSSPRAINDTWQNETFPDLGRIGRSSPDGEFKRPNGRWILDLVSNEHGWWLLEMAHMLAHKTEDSAAVARTPLPYTYGQTATLFQSMLFKIMLCDKFDLPIDTEPGSCDPDQLDPFSRYGIVPAVSTPLRNPVLRVPVNGRSSLAPGTICVVLGSVHIEPTPHAIAAGVDKWFAMNRWSCQPTITSFVGWELVDVVTHSPLLSSGKHDNDYAMLPMSLQSAESFKFFIDCAKESRGDCRPDNARFWLVRDYLTSDKFMHDLESAPTLPCKRCLRLNMDSDGSPARPRCERPDKAPKKGAVLTREQQEWKEWDDTMSKVFAVVEKATKYMEIRELGAGSAARLRRARKHAYSSKVNALRSKAYLERRAAKLRAEGYITKAEELENKVKEITNEFERT